MFYIMLITYYLILSNVIIIIFVPLSPAGPRTVAFNVGTANSAADSARERARKNPTVVRRARHCLRALIKTAVPCNIIITVTAAQYTL